MYTCGLSTIKITAFFFISFPGQPLIDPGEVNVSYYTGGSNTETGVRGRMNPGETCGRQNHYFLYVQKNK